MVEHIVVVVVVVPQHTILDRFIANLEEKSLHRIHGIRFFGCSREERCVEQGDVIFDKVSMIHCDLEITYH